MFLVKHIILAALLWLGGIQVSAASALLFNVALDTSALFGVATLLAFDFTDGDTLVNNTANISGFSADGVYDPAAATTAGDATGQLNASVVLGDADAFNELAQPIVLGNALSFTLNLSNQFSGLGPPDRLTLSLLDGVSGLPLYSTDDPTGADRLLSIDLNGGIPVVAAYQSPSGGGALVQVAGVSGLPEPPTVPLWMLGARLGRHSLRLASRRSRHRPPV